jgi:hypothetical protein
MRKEIGSSVSAILLADKTEIAGRPNDTTPTYFLRPFTHAPHVIDNSIEKSRQKI